MQKRIRILNLLALALLLVPAFFLHPFKENYSHLTTDASGYFYILFLAIVIGYVLYLELLPTSRKEALIAVLCFLVPASIAYDEPSTIKANLHVFLSYAGFAIIALITIYNVFIVYRDNRKRLIVARSIAFISFSIALYSYLNFLCVNTLSELSFAIGILLLNYLLYMEKTTA